MRTGGAVEDLVVVDLDDPDEVATHGPAAQRRHFEDRYAELPFGLGTVPRRLEHVPWYTRPGVLLWIAIALIGLVALAGHDTGSDDGPATSPGAVPFPVLTQKTNARLLFSHLDAYSVFDVDAGTFQAVEPFMLASRPVPSALDLESGPPDARGHRSLIAIGPSGPSVVTPDGYALDSSATSVVWRPGSCRVCPVRLTNEPTGRTTTLFHTTEGGPRGLDLAPNGSAVGLVDGTGGNSWTLRLMRASGRTTTQIELSFDAVTMTWSRDSRWLFVVSGATLLAIDRVTGVPARVGNTLPPFEHLETY